MPNFNLVTTNSTPAIAGDYRFEFGVGKAVFVYGIEFSKLGTASLVNKSLGVFTQGIAPVLITAPIVSYTKANFSFNLVITQVAPIITGDYRFRWGTQFAIAPMSIGNTSVFNSALVYNAALTIAPVGIPNPMGYNSPIVGSRIPNSYIPNKYNTPVGFNLIQGAQVWTTINFDFTGFISIGPGGVESLKFGNNSISNYRTYLNTVGYDYLAFGNHSILILRNLIVVQSIAPPTLSAPMVANSRKILTVSGFNTLAFGNHKIEHSTGGSNSYNFMMLLF